MTTKQQEQAIAALHKAEHGAWSRVEAYIIIHPSKPGRYGKIKVARPADGAGRLQVFVWDLDGSVLQYGSASGYGFDKLAAAIAGMIFDGIKLADHPNYWRDMLRERGYQIIQAI